MSDDMTTDLYINHPDYAHHFTNTYSGAYDHSYRPGQEGITITLSKGCTIKGKVVDENGKGIEGVSLHARLNNSSRRNYENHLRTVSGPGGVFTLTRIPEDTIFINTGNQLEDQGKWPSLGQRVQTSEDRPVNALVQVQQGFPVEFVVTDTETGNRIPNASVGLLYTLRLDQRVRYETSGKTNGFGRVTLQVLPGSYFVIATADGFVSMPATPAKIDKNTKRIPISLDPVASIYGKVVDAEGKPAAGVMVYPFPGRDSAFDLTNNAGAFKLPFQPYSKRVYLLTQDVEQNLCALTEITDDQKEYTLQLQKAKKIIGRIVDDRQKPIRGALVTTSREEPRASGHLGDKILSDENGQYTFFALPSQWDEKKFRFSVSATGYGGFRNRTLQIDNRQDTFAVEDIVLLTPDQTVSGIVVNKQGKPVPDYVVLLFGDDKISSQTSRNAASDDRGRFSFTNVCKSPLKVQAGWASQDSGSIQAYGGDHNLRIVLNESIVHPEYPTMIDRQIPSLQFDVKPVDPNQIHEKRIAVCFWSMDPTVKGTVFKFVNQLKAISRDDISPHFVSIWPLHPKKRDNIIESISFPVYDKQRAEMNLLRRKWGAKEIPWFIVTDNDQIIIYEGTSPDEATGALVKD